MHFINAIIKIAFIKCILIYDDDNIKSHYIASLLFCSNFISITKSHLLMAPLSMPQSYYLTVLPQEMSFNTFVEKFVLKKIRVKI